MSEHRPAAERRSVPPPGKSASPAVTTPKSEAVVYTLALLIQRFGRADAEHVEAAIGAADTEALVTSGQRISTARILRDGVRIVGHAGAFLAIATEAQREELIMVDATLLSVVTTALERAETAQRELDRQKNASSTVRSNAKDRGGKAVRKARLRRATLHEALLTATCGDVDWKRQVDEVNGAAESAAELADAIERQVAVGRKLVAWAKKRGASCALTEAYFTKTLSIAADAHKLGAEGVAPAPRDGTNQGEVNRLDGVCLWFLKRVIDTFDVAHEADPSIPKLPVLSLRAVFRRGARPKAKADPPTPPQPPTR